MSVAPAVAEPAAEPHPSPAELHRQFQQAAAFANRNTYRLLVLIRQMDACAGYEAYGCSTLAHYLELVCGITRIAARERIRVAFALEELPVIAQAFEAGEISYSKVRAVARVATAESDAEWLAAARTHTAEELETMATRSTPDDEGRRRLFTRPVNRLVTRMVVELPADEMEVINRALDRMREEAGGKLSMSEALVLLAADSLSGGSAAGLHRRSLHGCGPCGSGRHRVDGNGEWSRAPQAGSGRAPPLRCHYPAGARGSGRNLLPQQAPADDSDRYSAGDRDPGWPAVSGVGCKHRALDRHPSSAGVREGRAA